MSDRCDGDHAMPACADLNCWQNDSELQEVTRAVHDVDCAGGEACVDKLTTGGLYGRYAAAALAAIERHRGPEPHTPEGMGLPNPFSPRRDESNPTTHQSLAALRESAYQFVRTTIRHATARSMGDTWPLNEVRRNALIWTCVNGALDRYVAALVNERRINTDGFTVEYVAHLFDIPPHLLQRSARLPRISIEPDTLRLKRQIDALYERPPGSGPNELDRLRARRPDLAERFDRLAREFTDAFNGRRTPTMDQCNDSDAPEPSQPGSSSSDPSSAGPSPS